MNKWLYLLVFVAGVASVFAFAPFNFSPLAFLTPAVLFYSLTKATTTKQYFYLSWFFGIGLFGAGASWPFYSIYIYAHAPLAIAIFGVFLFVVFVALFSTGLFGLLAAQFKNSSVTLQLLLFYPAAWVFIEWTRSWFFTGFPWLYLGNSLIDTIFSAYAPITGVLGVSLIAVMIAGTLVTLLFGFSKQRIISIALITSLVIVAFLLKDISWTHKTNKVLTVSILQANIDQQEKLDPEKLDWALNRYQEMTMQSLDSDVIVWPETALFGPFSRYMDSIITPLQKRLRPNQVVLIGGFYINENNGVENSVLSITSEAREIYSKRHLVPFGEYIPFVEYLRWMGDWIPYSSISAGDKGSMLSVAGEQAQMTICYEDAFGAEMIQSLPEASMLINVTHDGWFTGSIEPEQHMQIARMRSLEMGRYMIRATTTGPAGIINEKGTVVATAPQYTKKIITHNVQPFTGATPYVKWGNWLIVGLLGFILSVGIIWNRKEKGKWQT